VLWCARQQGDLTKNSSTSSVPSLLVCPCLVSLYTQTISFSPHPRAGRLALCPCAPASCLYSSPSADFPPPSPSSLPPSLHSTTHRHARTRQCHHHPANSTSSPFPKIGLFNAPPSCTPWTCISPRHLQASQCSTRRRLLFSWRGTESWRRRGGKAAAGRRVKKGGMTLQMGGGRKKTITR